MTLRTELLTRDEATELYDTIARIRTAYENADDQTLTDIISSLETVVDAATDAWFQNSEPMSPANAVAVWVLAAADNASKALAANDAGFSLDGELGWVENRYPGVKAARYVNIYDGMDYESAEVMVALETINEEDTDAF